MPNHIIEFQCTSISWIGREVYPVIQPKPSDEAVARLVMKLRGISEIHEIQRGKVVSKDGRTNAFSLETVRKREPFPTAEG